MILSAGGGNFVFGYFPYGLKSRRRAPGNHFFGYRHIKYPTGLRLEEIVGSPDNIGFGAFVEI